MRPEWELFDLEYDSFELNGLYSDPAFADMASELKTLLRQLLERVGYEASDGLETTVYRFYGHVIKVLERVYCIVQEDSKEEFAKRVY